MPYSASTVEKPPKRGRLDHVDADLEERVVHVRDHVGAGEHEHLVAALEVGAAEVVGAEVEVLDVGAERAVEDDDALGDGVEVGLGGHDLTSLRGGPGDRQGHPAWRPPSGSVRSTEPR